MEKSRFASSLKDILDNTNFYTRKDWAHFLIVSEDEIENWLNDKELPSPFNLRLILDIITLSDAFNKDIYIRKFNKVLSGSAKRMTPLGKQIVEPTLIVYMNRR